jgi:hypothetical protein
MKFSKENKLAVRAFYQTLASESGATKEQVDFYKMVMAGNKDTRKKFALKYASKYIDNKLNLPPLVQALLESEEKFTKEDIAIMAASYMAPKIMSWLDRFLKAIFG